MWSQHAYVLQSLFNQYISNLWNSLQDIWEATWFFFLNKIPLCLKAVWNSTPVLSAKKTLPEVSWAPWLKADHQLKSGRNFFFWYRIFKFSTEFLASRALRQETLLLLGGRGPARTSECVLGAGNQGGVLWVQGWVLPAWPGKRCLCSRCASVRTHVSMSPWCGRAWAVLCRKLRQWRLGEEPGLTDWDLLVPWRCWKFSSGSWRVGWDLLWTGEMHGHPGSRLVLCRESLWCREAPPSISPLCLSEGSAVLPHRAHGRQQGCLGSHSGSGWKEPPSSRSPSPG